METPDRPVRVVIVDDHPVVRDGVTMSLGGSRAVVVVGYAGDGNQARVVVQSQQPDVILLDLRLRDTLAPELVSDLHRAAPDARIALFTAYPEHAAVHAAIEAGAVGVIVKDAGRADLLRAVLTIAREGQLPGTGARATALPSGVITPREYDVLRHVAMGHSNPEIAAQMHISRNTVKSYLQNALHKLGARNRVEAIAKARELGLL